MEVHGIDMRTASYRVRFRDRGREIRGLVPETLVAEWHPQSSRPSHGDVYQWLALHRRQIENTLLALSRGETGIRAPFDRLTLEKEDEDAN